MEKREKDSIYNLQMRYRRSGVKDVKDLSKDTNAFIMKYEPKERLKPNEEVKSGVDEELEKLADIWTFVYENIKRDEWKSYTRDDWEKLERQYVEKARYTEPDLFDDILTKYERGLFTADEARAYAKRFRKCKYRFCLDVFKPRRKDQRYCSDSDCRRREANAKIRYRNTGTYLPPHVYKENRDDTDEQNYKEREIAFNLSEAGNEEHEEDIELVTNRVLKYHRRYLTGTGERDESMDMYEYMKITEKDLKNNEESPSNRHYNHVYNREAL